MPNDGQEEDEAGNQDRIFVSCRGDRTRGAMAGSGLGGCGGRVTGQALGQGSGAPCSDWWEPAWPCSLPVLIVPAAKAVCRDKGPVDINPHFPPSPR